MFLKSFVVLLLSCCVSFCATVNTYNGNIITGTGDILTDDIQADSIEMRVSKGRYAILDSAKIIYVLVGDSLYLTASSIITDSFLIGDWEILPRHIRGIGSYDSIYHLRYIQSTIGVFDSINVRTISGFSGLNNVVYTTGSYADPSWITSLSGNKISGTITNVVYTTSTYSNPSWITGLAGSKITGSVPNADAVVNGVYTTGSYVNPSWINSLSGSKITGDVPTASYATNAGSATLVSNGVYTNTSYYDPSWITGLAGSKIAGNISGNAGTATNADQLDGYHASAFQAAGVFTGLSNHYFPAFNGTGFSNSLIYQDGSNAQIIIVPTNSDGISISGENGTVTKISANAGVNSDLNLEANHDVVLSSGNNINLSADDYINLETNLNDITLTSDNANIGITATNGNVLISGTNNEITGHTAHNGDLDVDGRVTTKMLVGTEGMLYTAGDTKDLSTTPRMFYTAVENGSWTFVGAPIGTIIYVYNPGVTCELRLKSNDNTMNHTLASGKTAQLVCIYSGAYYVWSMFISDY